MQNFLKNCLKSSAIIHLKGESNSCLQMGSAEGLVSCVLCISQTVFQIQNRRSAMVLPKIYLSIQLKSFSSTPSVIRCVSVEPARRGSDCRY